MKNHSPMVIISIIPVIFALMIIIIPQLTNCHSQGNDTALPS
jgi:hypothetical protein